MLLIMFVVGRLLDKKFKNVFWYPCFAHCINLILDAFLKLDEINDVVIMHASKITKHIYNRCHALHLMRKLTCGREILRSTLTYFAIYFIALKSILPQKVTLRPMVTSKQWTTKKRNASKFVDLIFDSTFWKGCVLHIFDNDER